MHVRFLPLLLLCALVVTAGDTTKSQLRFATRDKTGFQKLGKPEPGEWRDRFKERAQPFRHYVASNPVRAQGQRRVLAFLPVGPFQKHEQEVVDATVEFARIWFDLDVRKLKPRPLPRKGWQRQHGGRTQYRTPYFLDHLLPDNLPKDAVCVFGVTMADLYPEDEWNFVFGIASLHRRVGVWSLARYFEAFWGGKETDATRRRALQRACKVVVHEAGHAFGMEHCTYFSCNMQGSNSMRETDLQPLHLCPVCLKKLQWNRGFDVLARYRKLLAFFQKRGLTEDAKWTRARIASIAAH